MCTPPSARFFGILLLLSATIAEPHARPLALHADGSSGTITVVRAGESKPVLTQNAGAEMRPYLHPIAAPDGKGVLTEFSPAHHKHQTGIYWGLTSVNGRDYFKNPA